MTAPYGTWPALPRPDQMTGAEYLLAEALRGQVMTIHMLTTALADRGSSSAAGASQMIGAAVDLVRAADGAAMPLRRPPPPPPAVPPPAPPAPPATPSPEALMAALQRNAMLAIDDDDAGVGGDAANGPTEQDMFAKVLAIADKVQGVIAPVADVARLVMGGFGNPAALRNAGEVEGRPRPPMTAPTSRAGRGDPEPPVHVAHAADRARAGRGRVAVPAPGDGADRRRAPGADGAPVRAAVRRGGRRGGGDDGAAQGPAPRARHRAGPGRARGEAGTPSRSSGR